ncbi:MAG: RluA family pseudouridine synthase [Bacteriovoracales bacterium]|nr:RluA family pseudouridine synthase [Bacteriovoracales bacterium]
MQPEEREEQEGREKQIEIHIADADLQHFRRLDHFLAHKTKLSRMTIKRLFDNGEITAMPSSPIKMTQMPKEGTTIWINLPPPIPTDLTPEKIPLDILEEDDHLIFINKPPGMVVHPAPGNRTGTLLNALLFHCPHLSGIGGVQRPGIVHRLDKGTSGVMVAAKTQRAHEKLIERFAAHDIERTYVALAQPGKKIPPVGTIETLINRHPKNRLKMSSFVQRGKRAVTHYQILRLGPCFQLVELKLETGRTHQIRVHLSERLRIPILCDPLYANRAQQRSFFSERVRAALADYPFPLLHAQKLGLRHPVTQKYREFEVPPPAPFQDLMADL